MMTDCPSRFVLVQLQTGDLSAQDAEGLRAHLDRCHDCHAHWRELEKNVASYEGRANEHLVRLRARLTEEDPRPWWPRKLSPALPVAAGVAVVILMITALWPTRSDQQNVAFKGSFGLQLVARRGADQFPVKAGTRLQQGDALRFVLTTATPGYVSVFSLDARKIATPFYPSADPRQAPAPLRLKRRGEHVLDESIVLDDAVGQEQIVVLFSRRSFSRDKVHAMVVALLEKNASRAEIRSQIGLETEIITVNKTPVGAADEI